MTSGLHCNNPIFDRRLVIIERHQLLDCNLWQCLVRSIELVRKQSAEFLLQFFVMLSLNH